MCTHDRPKGQGWKRPSRSDSAEQGLREVYFGVCVLVQIESRVGMENLDKICAVEGVDGIFIGSSDLAAALGHLGNPNHADVQQAIGDIFACAECHRRSVGILAPVEADARRYLEQGACFVAVGSDQGLLCAATQALRDRFREP